MNPDEINRKLEMCDDVASMLSKALGHTVKSGELTKGVAELQREIDTDRCRVAELRKEISAYL